MLTDALIRGGGGGEKAPLTAGPHGSYNLEKVLNFTSRLEKSLNSVACHAASHKLASPADILRGAGTRDEPLRTSAWEASHKSTA